MMLEVSNAAERDFKSLPKDAQEDFAKALEDVLHGQRPNMAFKHVSETVGKGAIELIINGSPAYRVIYVAKYNDKLYLLHAFTKTTNGVDLAAMKTARKRYKDIPKNN